jgi:hypothetical protein
VPSGRLSLLQLAWRQLKYERASSAGVAFALLLTLLPAGSLAMESSGDGADLHVVNFAVKLQVAVLMPLLVLLAGVLSRWYIELRLRDLALLRGRGWSPTRVQLLVLAEFAMLAATAFGIGVVGLLVLAWRADGGSSDLGLALPRPSELPAIAVAVEVPLAAAAVWLIGLAWWASRQNVMRLDHPEANPARLLFWRGVNLDGLLVLPAALLLLLRRWLRTPGWGTSAALDDLGALLLSVGGLALLLMASPHLMSLAAEALFRRRLDVEGTLAQWQLHRWWQRHTATGFLIVLAFAMASLSAVALAHQELDRPAPAPMPGGQGVAISLGIGFAASTAAALMAYGLVFLSACRARMDDYTALLVDGLSVDKLRRSLWLEQATVLVISLLVGGALGLVVLWANAPAIGLEGGGGAIASSLSAGATAVGVVSTLAIGILAGAAVAWLVRRSAVGFRLLEYGQRLR